MYKSVHHTNINSTRYWDTLLLEADFPDNYTLNPPSGINLEKGEFLLNTSANLTEKQYFVSHVYPYIPSLTKRYTCKADYRGYLFFKPKEVKATEEIKPTEVNEVPEPLLKKEEVVGFFVHDQDLSNLFETSLVPENLIKETSEEFIDENDGLNGLDLPIGIYKVTRIGEVVPQSKANITLFAENLSDFLGNASETPSEGSTTDSPELRIEQDLDSLEEITKADVEGHQATKAA